MGKLLLDSLEIQNFRGFRHLQIERLGRVNLIVGKNNIGKSSLLEALELYARRGIPSLIWQLLRTRDEVKNAYSRSEENLDELLTALKYLFYGRKEVNDNSVSIHIGPLNSLDDTLSISVGWFAREFDAQEGLSRWQPLQPDEYLSVDNSVPRLKVSFGQDFKADYPLQVRPHRIGPSRRLNSVSIGANGLDKVRTSSLWDRVTLTALDGEVLNALQIVAPGVIGLSFIGEEGALHTRVPLIRLKDIEEPLPLASLGNGMFRILSIVLALADARNGMLLVDEIENGIHYTIHHELWALIFRLARQLDVQVFATTHSWDCIEAFQKAAAEDKQEEGMLLRLSLGAHDEIKATLYDERRLEIATREQIEVR
ncbi:MAG TPA: AAA family ATPase [Ktedonobacteraceae bacterium]|nr:AAA family ATPase [Ktedonobacteraceae bacterium]